MEPIPDEPRCFGQTQTGRRCQRMSAITRCHDCGDYYCNVHMERPHHVCLDPHGSRHRLIDKMKDHVLHGTDFYGNRVAGRRGGCERCIAALVYSFYGDNLNDAARFCDEGGTIAREYGFLVQQHVGREAVKSYIADRYPYERSRFEFKPDQ
jgi:hypothetical protein